jgi:5'-nucleotidase
MGDVIADAQLAATTSAGAQISFMNAGGVRAELTYAQISGGERAGEVTYEEAFAIEPFANELVTLTLTGAQLHALLEQQWSTMPGGGIKQTTLFASGGFSYTFDAAAPIGSRVDTATMMLAGAPIDPVASYRVTASAFLATGGDGFTTFKAGTDTTPGGVDLDALVGYLGAHTPLAPPATDRVTHR